MEILWLMTRAWNTGIFQYTVGKCREAEQWCGLGMRFLSHLGSLKKTYEGHVSKCKQMDLRMWDLRSGLNFRYGSA